MSIGQYSHYRWLQLLLIEHVHQGYSSLRTLAKETNVSHTYISRIFKGEKYPAADVVKALAKTIARDQDMYQLILSEYEDEEPPERIPKRHLTGERKDARIELADAINNLASAIRELARKDE